MKMFRYVSGLRRKKSDKSNRFPALDENSDNKHCETVGTSTFDVIKYGRWMGTPTLRQRRMGLPEEVIRNDCLQIQEKMLFRGSFRTYWP